MPATSQSIISYLLNGLRTVPLFASRRTPFRLSPCRVSTLLTSCNNIKPALLHKPEIIAPNQGSRTHQPHNYHARAARWNDVSRHRRRPRFRSLRSSRLERSAIWRHHRWSPSNDGSRHCSWSLTVWLLFLTCVVCFIFSVVKCSWSFPTLRHYNNNIRL